MMVKKGKRTRLRQSLTRIYQYSKLGTMTRIMSNRGCELPALPFALPQTGSPTCKIATRVVRRLGTQYTSVP